MFQNKRIHFMGAGGIGVSALLRLSLKHGAIVSGCDLKKNATTEELEKLGVPIAYGHHPSHIKDVDMVVFTSAVTSNNLELMEARAKGVECIKRSVMLNRLMQDNQIIGVSGSHGKTTTTGLIAHILIKMKLDPSVAVGGLCPSLDGKNFRIGSGNWFVTELDESDASLLDSSPIVGVLTNIDQEHLEYYGNMNGLLKAYSDYCDLVQAKGKLVYYKEDKYIEKNMKLPNAISYGYTKNADCVIRSLKQNSEEMKFEISYENNIYQVQSRIKGEYNALNISAAILATKEMGVSIEDAILAIGDYENIRRRFDILYDQSCLLIDDYAHHPTEILACLNMCRAIYPNKKIRVLFQAHRYTRLRDLWDEFKGSLYQADEIIVCDIYAAGEEPIPGVTGDRFAKEMLDSGKSNVQFINHFDPIIEYLFSSVSEEDVVISLGAGDVNKILFKLSNLLVSDFHSDGV